MSRLLEIKVTKCVLYLTEEELMNGLPRETLLKGIKRGKSIKRNKDEARRIKEKKTAKTE